MNFAEHLEAKRISPSQAAREIGVTYQSIRRWRDREAKPTHTMQLKIQDWSGGAVTPADWGVKAVECQLEENCK